MSMTAMSKGFSTTKKRRDLVSGVHAGHEVAVEASTADHLPQVPPQIKLCAENAYVGHLSSRTPTQPGALASVVFAHTQCVLRMAVVQRMWLTWATDMLG